MGRMDTNTTQYHQGLQVTELHRQAPETIDEAPPIDEAQDLYQPQPSFRPKKLINQPNDKTESNVPVKTEPEPLAFPPTPLPSASHQDNSNQPNANPPLPPHVNPAAWPPSHGETTAAWPPFHGETPAAWPPSHGETTAAWPPSNGKTAAWPPPHGETTQAAFQPAVTGFPTQPHDGNIPRQQPNMPPGVQFSPVQPQPMMTPIPVPNQPQPWKTELFDCMQDPKSAIMTFLFPCVTFGQIAEIMDEGRSSCATSGMIYSVIAFCIAMPCIMSYSYRSKMRNRFGLMEAPLPDFMVHCIFEWCALCQEYRELQLRGIDPSIGYLGNVARQQQQRGQFVMTPPLHQRMM